MTDSQETNAAEVMTKRNLRSNATWKSGEKLPFCYNPSVEGMVVATRWVDEAFMVVFLVPPFKKEGGTWAEAALAYKTANTMIKETLLRYDYPFPKDYRIVREVNRANGNLEILQELVNYINKTHPPPANISLDVSAEPPVNVWAMEDAEAPAPPPSTDDRLSLHMLLSQPEEAQQGDNNQLSAIQKEKIMHAVSHRFRLTETPELKVNESETASTKSNKKHKKKSKHKKKEKSSSSSSSSSPSSSSSSSSSSDTSSSDSEVRSKKKDNSKGWIKCPFSNTDSRMAINPKEKMKSTKSERTILRKALQNLYNHFTTLKWFVETQKVDSTPSITKPYASDIVWLKIHASYLDHLLLQSAAGAWTSWNEIIVDDLARSFLELIVRTSPERKYPDILDGKVRRWMKRNRVGLSSSFGAIPTFLADAKITESGIQPKGGWEILKKKDTRATTFPPRAKTAAATSTASEKK